MERNGITGNAQLSNVNHTESTSLHSKMIDQVHSSLELHIATNAETSFSLQKKERIM